MLKTKIRMLAAIMFTDMAGYTALMQQNESKAKSLRDRQKKILEEKVFEHKGQILQYYGDGTLSIFGSVIEAAECAKEIQIELQKEPVVWLRIGIHIGDVVYDDEGVYGDAVNVASRIENLSVPGGVFISEKVYDEIRNHENLQAVVLGKFELKNVSNPVKIYALSSNGLNVPPAEEIKKKAVSKKFSIAVLPFTNMSPDPENEYFSDGITEEILNALSKVDGLLVTSRTSSFAFKGKNKDIREIGTQLGVNTVLEGSVRKINDRVRITAQLISTQDGYHQWSETYDRRLEDIFEIQDEISKEIAERLQEKFSDADIKQPLVKQKTYNLEAYNLFLKARFYWNRWTYEDFQRAIKCNEEAIKIDPAFPLAYVGLSNCYLILASMNYLHPKEAYPKAKEYALKAMNLDDSLSESHFSLALVQMFYDWKWDCAFNSFQKALEINPGSADVHYTYSLYLIVTGKFREALSEVEKAHTMDPLSLPINNFLAAAYYYLQMYDEAINQFHKTLELDSNFEPALHGLAMAYITKGEYVQAIKVLKDTHKLPGNEVKLLAPLGYAYAKFGMIEKAKECLRELIKYQDHNSDSTYNMDLAILYAGLNDQDKVFHHLDLAIEDKSGGVIFLNVHPEWIQLKADPRFRKIVKRVGLE